MEKVGIEINLINADEAEATLKRIEASTKRLGAKRTKIQMEDGSLVSVDERIKQIQDRLAALSAAKKIGVITPEETREAQRLSAELKVISRGLKDGTANAKTFKQVFNSISSAVAHAGSAMQSMGNALTRIGSFMRPITTGLLMGVGYNTLNLATEGFSGALGRADALNKYTKLMAQYETANYSAIQSRQDLDASIQGLPIALDDAISLAQRYTLSLGDMERGTQLAIATNNAFLASMATEQQRYQGMLQLQDLMNGKKLTGREWMSLGSSMGKAINEIGLKLGYSSDQLGVFRQELYAGNIATKDFLDALIAVGTGEGSLVDLAKVSAETWEGLSSNIRIAFSRMGANVIETLNSTFQSATGRTLLQLLLGRDANGKEVGDGIKHWIDGISTSMQDWIKANPDRIIDFFETLKSIDFKGLLKGIAEGMGDILGIIERLAKAAEGKDLSKLGRFLAKSGFWGRTFTIIGGLIKGMRHPLAAIGTAGSWLFKGRAGGFFGKIAELFGKKKDITIAGEAGEAIGKAAPHLLSAFKNMALISGIVAMPAFTAWGVTSAVKNSVKNFKETIDLFKGMDWASAGKLAGGIAVFLGASAGLGAIVGKFGVGAGVTVAIGETIVGIITSIATGFADLNMSFIKDSIKKFVESINLLDEIPDVSSFGDVKTKISNAIDMMNEISELLQPRYVDKGVSEGGIQGIGIGVAWAINGIAKALAPLKDAVERINEIASMSISESAVDNIGKIIDAISEIQAQMWKLLGFGFDDIKKNMTAVADAMYELRRIIYHVGKLAGEKISTEGLANVTEAIQSIEDAFDAEAISSLRSKITTFVASIQDAFTELDKLNTPIEIKASVKLSKDFKTSVDAVVRDIGLARRRISLAWAGIPTFFSKTITFSLGARVVANNLYAGASEARRIAESVRPAKGGLIYRAKGGGVPWKRRGTDTVPAMLTPGEYVHNKRAVNAFGIDFMRKVNNLDMKGAMNELMHRAGHMANINRGATITNNNYNNQKVVINNSNAGAGYTFRTASRFVGAF